MSLLELNYMPMLNGKRSVVVSTAGLLKAIEAFDCHGQIGDKDFQIVSLHEKQK